MKRKAKKRLTLLLGAVLLSMLVVATTVQVASAMHVTGGATAGSTESSTAASPPAALGQVSSAQHNRLAALDAAGVGVTESSGISSTTVLIIVAVVAGALIGVWAFARRRRGLTAAVELTTSEVTTAEVNPNAFCSLHPQDAKCGAV